MAKKSDYNTNRAAYKDVTSEYGKISQAVDLRGCPGALMLEKMLCCSW